ncbi:hypothetical protein CC78DRAFT_577784 [Lojkania enalia]|uniref:Uncharacterized protein n=1 Tax=Lojkania enalia TaxID=147567 RepID=A0A9P4KCS1_9PLEO|nr:hypothetical protein CC78DRAFT_577784 [Didymosphaeria enalia]
MDANRLVEPLLVYAQTTAPNPPGKASLVSSPVFTEPAGSRRNRSSDLSGGNAQQFDQSSPAPDETMTRSPRAKYGDTHATDAETSIENPPLAGRAPGIIKSLDKCFRGLDISSSKLNPEALEFRPLSTSPGAQCENLKTPSHSTNSPNSSSDVFMSTRSHFSNPVITIRGPSPSPTAYHKRPSRMASLPSVPTSLGPGGFTDDLESYVDDLVSESPPHSTNMTSPNMAWELGSQATRHSGTRYGVHTRQKESHEDELVYGYIPDIRSTGIRPGTMHHYTQNLSDPFVVATSQNVNVPQAQCSTCFPPQCHRQPAYHDPPLTHPSHPPHPPHLPIVPSGHPSSPLPTTTPLPRPTTANPESRLRIRERWIRSAAANIAGLHNLHLKLAQEYHETHSSRDLEVLTRVVEALREATSLDRRVAERRGMFMPEGMTILRTGFGSLPRDGIGGVDGVGGNGNSGRGRLSGYRMAVMERICAEVVAGREQEDTATTGEFCSTLW